MPAGADNSGKPFSITTRRPVAILMVVMAVCVFGWVSYQRLSMDLMPNITYPTLTVRTEYAGSAPEEVESFISRPLEQELAVVPNLVGVSSISKAGQSDVILELEWDADMNAASQDIREKVDRVRLPEDAVKPLLLRYDPSLDPIVRIGLYGDESLLELRILAEQEIKRALEAVSGVAAVKVKGGFEEEVHIALNERQIALLGLDVQSINDRLARDNINLPGGLLREGETEYLLRTLNEFRTLADIGNVVVARGGAGSSSAEVRLRDIATVERAHKEREVITRYNGRESIEIEIYKEADANIVSVSRRVAERLFGTAEQQAFVASMEEAGNDSTAAAALDGGEAAVAADTVAAGQRITTESTDDGEDGDAETEDVMARLNRKMMTDFVSYSLPTGVELKLLSDQSEFIVEAVREVQLNALVGGAMAIFVLFIFLRNVTRALIIGITIPVSIVATFAPMHLFDVSLNIMSLGGIALGIGMLVDNSIVVLESIFRRREQGDDLIAATVRGTGEVGSAVVASTLTTIAVFFPIVFVEGVAGQVFGDMALTVVFSLLASLAVALFFIPMLASRQPSQVPGAGNPILDNPFLRPPALRELVDAATAGSLPLGERVGRVLVAAARLALQLLVRLGAAGATLVTAILKFAFLVLFETSWLLLKPLEVFWIRPERTWQTTVSGWAADSDVGGLRFYRDIWPGITGFQSVADLLEDLRLHLSWVARARSLRLLLVCPLVPPTLIFLLARFYLQSLLRLVGIVAQLLLMTGALLAIGLVCLAGLIASPLILPPLYLFGRGMEVASRLYPALLQRALDRRLLVTALAAGIFIGTYQYLVPQLGREFIPQVHQGEFDLNVSLPVGTPLDATAAVLKRIEQLLINRRDVAGLAAVAGSERTATSAAEEGEHTGRITVELASGVDAAGERQMIGEIRQGVGELPDVAMEISRPVLFSFKTPVEVEIRGHDLDQLRRHGRTAELAMAELPELADVTSSLQTGNPELQIVYNRRLLAEYGLSLRQVATLVRNKVQGRVATEFRAGERNIDIVVRLRQDDRFGIVELKRLVVNPGGEIPLYLESVADFAVREGPSEIRRIDQQRAVAITANVTGVDLGTAIAQVESVLGGLDFSTDFSYMISGQNQEMEKSINSLLFALALAIFLVYIVMASQFESVIHPFVIMFSVPLALAGAVAALAAAGIALSIVVFIGFIMLAGIVVNNAIVLVDYINRLRRDGLPRQEAIVRAASARLRPILMTTTTTVLALLPMALGLGEGAEIRMPMALTVIAGLATSTILTLIVIPTVYALVDRRP